MRFWGYTYSHILKTVQKVNRRNIFQCKSVFIVRSSKTYSQQCQQVNLTLSFLKKKCSTGFYRIKAKICPFCRRKINLGPIDSFRKIYFIVNLIMFKCLTQDWQKLIRISHPKYSGLLESTFTICCHGSKNNRTSCYCGCC